MPVLTFISLCITIDNHSIVNNEDVGTTLPTMPWGHSLSPLETTGRRNGVELSSAECTYLADMLITTKKLIAYSDTVFHQHTCGGDERPPAILSQTGEECIFSVKGIANAHPTLISDVLCCHCGVYRELVGNFVLLQMWLSLSVC